MKSQNKRIGYIDALRGFTMILVVFAHVELFSLGITFDDTVIGSMFITFRMPMFFFISGFIAFKEITWNNSYFLKMLKKKSKVQIIPTLFFFILYYNICLNTSIDAFFTKGPMAYWFTIVLFYMFLLYYTIMLISSKCNKKSWVSDIILVILGIIGAITYIGSMKFYKLDNYPLLCLINLSRYFEFFILGILCRKYHSTFNKIISNDNIRAILLLAFLSIFILSWKKTLIINYSIIQIFNLEFTLRFLGLFTVFSIFFHYRETFDNNNKSIKALRFIGRRTLDIYLIHYFFLPDLKLYFERFYNDGGLIPQNSIIEFFIVILLTLLVISISLLTSAIIRSSSILGHYLLGAKLPEI